MKCKRYSRASRRIQQDTLSRTEARDALCFEGSHSACFDGSLEKSPSLWLSCMIAATHVIGRFAHDNGAGYAHCARRTASPLRGPASAHARR